MKQFIVLSAYLFFLSFANAASEKPALTTIAFLGDSLTEGYGLDKNKAFPALIENILKSKGKNVKVINAGISGSTSASAPSRMKWLLKAKPDWVVLALGANDGLRGLDIKEMKKNLVEAIEIAENAKIKILFAGMKVPPNFGEDYSKNFEKAFSDVAKQKSKVIFLPFLLEKVGGEKKLNLPDGIHPNEEGHKIMADLVLKYLEPKL